MVLSFPHHWHAQTFPDSEALGACCNSFQNMTGFCNIYWSILITVNLLGAQGSQQTIQEKDRSLLRLLLQKGTRHSSSEARSYESSVNRTLAASASSTPPCQGALSLSWHWL